MNIQTTTKMPFRWTGMKRWFRYKYLLLTRAKGGPSIVALGFSIGLAIEMFTLPTGGMAFFLIFPSVYLSRSSLAGALTGFVFGKLIYIPMTLLLRQVGHAVLQVLSLEELLTNLPLWLDKFVKLYLELFVGGVMVGPVLGLLAYFPMRHLLKWVSSRRTEKRKLRKAAIVLPSK